MSGINERMLTRQLRDLEYHQIVSRKVYPEIPPRVEYTLTESGESLIPILDILEKWGRRHQMSRHDGNNEPTLSDTQNNSVKS